MLYSMCAFFILVPVFFSISLEISHCLLHSFRLLGLLCGLKSSTKSANFYSWLKLAMCNKFSLSWNYNVKYKVWWQVKWSKSDLFPKLSFKILKINPSMYKPSKQVTHQNPPLNRPSKYKPPRGFVLGNCPQLYKVKQSKTVHFLPIIRLAQSILKRKFPFVHKPLQI